MANNTYSSHVMPQVNNKQNGGMWDGGNSFWTPPSGFTGATQPNQYDIGYVSGGMGMLKDSAYKPTGKYNPYQFNRTSDKEFGDTYNKAMQTATTPMLAQGKERMRQVSQGWGANQMSSAAGKELAMKNAQKTGSDIADVGRSIGSNMAMARMAEGQEVQKRQAAENYIAAGFSEDQAKAMADDVYKRAGAMIGGGFNWINFQRGAAQDEYNKYNDASFDESWI